MSVESILSIVKKIIDICLIWSVFYYVLKNIRNPNLRHDLPDIEKAIGVTRANRLAPSSEIKR